MSRLALQLIDENKKKHARGEDATRLDIGRCGLTELPDELFDCVWLKELVVSNGWWDGEKWKWNNSFNNGKANLLKALNPKISSLAKLRRLIIGGDIDLQWGIADIKPIEKLTHLTLLNLSGNQITDIKPIEKLINLTSLDLTDNQIADIKPIEKLNNLTSLNLRENQIADIKPIEKLINLNSLDLAENQIADIKPIEKLNNLTSLYLTRNKITEIKSIEKLTHLASLNLRENQIADIKPIEKLNNLTSLYLGFNEISNISALLNLYKQGCTIYVNGNPIESPPLSIVENGAASIIAYFEELESGAVKLVSNPHFKIILAGNSEAGKSEFCKLFNPNKKNDRSTHYLEMEEWKAINGLIPKINLPANARARVFDLGGQEYYHDTHPLYFSGNTAYLLFWEPDTNLATPMPSKRETGEILQHYPLEYWLEAIAYFTRSEEKDTEADLFPDDEVEGSGKEKSGFSHNKTLTKKERSRKEKNILLIETHISERDNQPFFIDQQHYARINPQIAGFCATDLKHKTRWPHLQLELKTLFEQLTILADKVPHYYPEIIAAIDTNKKLPTIFDSKDFLRFCNKQLKSNVPKYESFDAQAGLLAYLRGIGQILYFPEADNPALHQKIVVNIPGFTRAVYDLFDEFKKRNGELEPDATDRDILLFLEEFNLIFAHPDPQRKNTYIAPLHLPEEPAHGIRLFLNTLPRPERRFVFKWYIHKTIILQFFAQYGRKAYSEKGIGEDQYYYWRNGIIITNGGRENPELVLVRFEMARGEARQEGLSYIEVFRLTPAPNNDFMTGILHTLRQITRNWNVKEMVSSNSEDFIEVQELNQYAEKKMVHFLHNGKSFSLADFNQWLARPLDMKKLFISYAEEDRASLEVLDTWLSTLKRQGLIATWYDRKLAAGSNWDKEIRRLMEAADMILLLVTPDYFKENKKYIWDVEIPIICKQGQIPSKTIIPIIIKNTPDWDKVTIGKDDKDDSITLGDFNGLPKKSYIKSPDWHNEDEAWANVAEGIKRLIPGDGL